MNHRRHGGGCTLLAAALLAGVTALPAPAAAQIYGAKATRVADTPPAGSNGDAVVTLSARFLTSGPLDLSSVKAAVLSVLLEGGAGGAGELLQGTAGASLLPVTLEPNRGARADSAIFATPGSARPSVRLAVKHRGGGEYQMNLRVNRATIPIGPALCSADDPSTTTLSTAIAFGDGVGPVSGGVMLTQPWRCESGRLRITNAPVVPPDGNFPPTASVRTEQLTRTTGEPDLVELDGSNSEDPDGTIASYSFSVADKDTGAVVFGPVVSASPTVEATIPPGDWVARLIVTDDEGKVSAPGTRGFTVR